VLAHNGAVIRNELISSVVAAGVNSTSASITT
jgi:hypothetical protein